MRILLVEDDANLALGVEYALKNEGFDVVVAPTALKARAALEEKFDLALLDVMLPDGSGYDLCKTIRSQGDMSVIFLTACDDEVNVVMGLDLGGDDYMTKPFRIKELLSRIKAVMRRTSKTQEEGGMLMSGAIALNTLEFKCVKNESDILLTALEYKLLLAFLHRARQVIPRNKLLELLWDNDGEFVDDNALSVYIRRLREKIEDHPDRPAYITTVRGVGYKWDADVRRN